jgi:hypothetical protein
MKPTEKKYTVIPVMGHLHVICQQSDRSSAIRSDGSRTHRDANYMNTGLALCGVIKKTHTLQQWIELKRKRERKVRKKEVSRAKFEFEKCEMKMK